MPCLLHVMCSVSCAAHWCSHKGGHKLGVAGVACVETDCTESSAIESRHLSCAFCTCRTTHSHRTNSMHLRAACSRCTKSLRFSAGIDRWASPVCAWGSLTRSANTRSGIQHSFFTVAVSDEMCVHASCAPCAPRTRLHKHNN